MFPGPHGTMRASATPGLLLQFAQRHLFQVALSVGVPAYPAPRPVRVVEHHERLGRGRVDRPDRARHMRERVALEDPRVGFQLSEDNLAIGCLLLVEVGRSVCRW